MFRTYAAWRPCSATIQKVSSSSPSVTGFRRVFPDLRPVVSSRTWPGRRIPILTNPRFSGLNPYFARDVASVLFAELERVIWSPEAWPHGAGPNESYHAVPLFVQGCSGSQGPFVSGGVGEEYSA